MNRPAKIEAEEQLAVVAADRDLKEDDVPALARRMTEIGQPPTTTGAFS